MEANDLKLYELYLNKIKETDEISFKLLSLVPLISGVGIFTLLTQNTIKIGENEMQIPIIVFWLTGIFGALITYCIYRWELRNIQTCKAYRDEAKKIEEKELGQVGIFMNFPKTTIGKTEAEKGIYFLTIFFWLLLPVLKMYINCTS